MPFFLPLFTQLRGREILGSPFAGTWIKPLNTPVLWYQVVRITVYAARYYLELDKDARSRIAPVRLAQVPGPTIEGYLPHNTCAHTLASGGTLPAPDRGLAAEQPAPESLRALRRQLRP
jgi:hypothetical protein